jgi:hypothetical protein
MTDTRDLIQEEMSTLLGRIGDAVLQQVKAPLSAWTFPLKEISGVAKRDIAFVKKLRRILS